MSTPHVVGSMALLRECVDGNGVPITNANAVSDLAATGVNVTRNGVTRKRINVLDAATSNVNNNDFAFPEVFAGNGPFNDFDFNVCADSEAGEPGPFSRRQQHLVALDAGDDRHGHDLDRGRRRLRDDLRHDADRRTRATRSER